MGMLIRECSLPGETRADDAVPAHPSGGVRLSRDRWLLLYATRGFRGVDDDRSIVYQLRRDRPDGPVIREGLLARSIDDWDALGDGKKYVRQFGHPVAFGVPKGASARGKPLAQGNVFVAKWRVIGLPYDPVRKALIQGRDTPRPRQTQGVEWVQFRLNERGDDIELLQAAGRLRQKGYETGPAFCHSNQVEWMNQSFTPPVPFVADGSQWVDCNHFDGGQIAVLKYVFNPKLGRYEWTEMGPLLGDRRTQVFEASIARAGTHWLIAARGGRGVAWARTNDPFVGETKLVAKSDPPGGGPRTLFRCGDGVLRLFMGAGGISPRKNDRDPLYCWDVDAGADFACTARHTLFDSVAAGLKIRPAATPKVDMCKLLPAVGRSQVAVYRVSVRSYNFPYRGRAGIPAINTDEKAACGIYATRITYADEVAPEWEFA
jgi:hypothetical protein